MMRLYEVLYLAEEKLKVDLPKYFKHLVENVKDENKKEILAQIYFLITDPKADIMDLFFY